MLPAAIPAIIAGAGRAGAVAGAVRNTVANLFNGSSSDVMARVWKNISDADAWRFNAVKRADGWHDLGTNAKLSQEESDRRVTSVIARYVGAERREDGYWYDKVNGAQLTSQEALDRWNATYGNGATPATVLQFPPRYVSGSVAAPPPPTMADDFREYVRDEVDNARDAVRQSLRNIADTTQAAGAGAVRGAEAGAGTEIASQFIERNKVAIIAIIATVGVVAFVALSRRGK